MASQKPLAPESALPPSSAAYTVLARRYRPQTFTDLVGQEPVARALGNAIKSNRVAHAYLFTGARGVGKTSTARILAKALNCAGGPTPAPCGECDICKSIAAGDDVDVLEIDGASNNGVDDVRDLRSNSQYSPARARFKIYIIDEVHMLSKGAFNALLKTLEEPPPHVKFIFATTEVDKVPITILSRCQRFDFAGISLPLIVERLQAIVEAEGVPAEPEAIERIARRAGRSMRDAQSLLDQLLAFGGETLTVDQVHRLLGTACDDRILDLAEAVLGKDAKKALDLLDEFVIGGLQLGELLDQLIGYWRDLMVAQCGGTEGRDFSIPARCHDILRRHAKSVSLDSVLAGLDVLATAKARLRGSSHGRTLVEMALVRLGRLHDLVALSQIAQWLGQGKAEQRPTLPAPAVAPSRSALPEPVKKNSLTASPDATARTGPVPLTEANWAEFWPQIVPAVGGMLATNLAKSFPPAISGPNTLVFHFPSGYNHEREFCQSPERLSRLEEAVSQAVGKPWKVRIEAGPVQEAPSPAAAATNGHASAPRPKRSTKEDAEKTPLVKRALEVLGASIQRVEDGFGDGRQPGGEEG